MTAVCIVLEGADGCGKSTQSRLLAECFTSKGLKAVRVEPSREAHPRLRAFLYWMLGNGVARRFPSFFQFVMVVNKLYYQLFRLPKLRRDNDVVVIDRWGLSAHVYGSLDGANRFTLWLNKALLVKPTVTVVIVGRCLRTSGGGDSYEQDTALQDGVRVFYDTYARNHPDDHVVVENWDWKTADPKADALRVHGRLVKALQAKGII